VCAPVRIGFQAKASDARVLKELLSPWDISFTSPEQADIVIINGCEEPVANKAIIIPHDKPDFLDLLKKQKLRLENSFHKPIQVAVSQQTALTIWPEKLYDYERTAELGGKENSPAELDLNDSTSLLKVDVVKEYRRIVDPILDGKSSTLYRLLTNLPIRYDAAPKKIRDFVMREKRDEKTINYCDKLPLDALRFIVAKAVERLSGKRLARRTWKGKKSCCIVTHDVDTKQGLARAGSIKKLEERYDVESAWYVPTRQYSLDSGMIKELANHGEVGVHGAQHSGNLINLPSHRLFKLLYDAKQFLEKISDSSVKGFRSPLLQHNSTILDELKKAGYGYDTSIPTWEPKHPQTMSPFGIGTVFPLRIYGLIEIPVSIVQDHQLLYVSGLTARETIAQWSSLMSVVKEVGGCNVLLSHPEYKLFEAENLFLFEDFLNALTANKESWITTPNSVAIESCRLD
jgi:peptidoglycan/xylan/chitin deacetylase (PgdA/CDA1 family)